MYKYLLRDQEARLCESRATHLRIGIGCNQRLLQVLDGYAITILEVLTERDFLLLALKNHETTCDITKFSPY
jgi:hypothetical protein